MLAIKSSHTILRIPAIQTRPVINSIGAGDALLSATTLGYKCSKNIFISAILGNAAAAVACEKEGNHPISINDIEQKLINITTRKFE